MQYNSSLSLFEFYFHLLPWHTQSAYQIDDWGSASASAAPGRQAMPHQGLDCFRSVGPAIPEQVACNVTAVTRRASSSQRLHAGSGGVASVAYGSWGFG